MKEYKTLKVRPDEENLAIQCYETFGWELDQTREVYNESQEIVGVNQNVKSNNAFMRGFTGNDGTVTTNVQTRTNVTHYLSMRFSRETSMKNYNRISDLQKEYDSIEYMEYSSMPKKPIGMTVLGLFGFISIILPIGAIINWIVYAQKKKKAVENNAKADEVNPKLKKRIQEIIAESRQLVAESKAA